MSDEQTETTPEPDPLAGRSPEERERILASAKAAKQTIIAVAAVAIGGIVFMFLITLVAVALKYW